MDTPAVAAARISELVPARTSNWGIIRCDGTIEELAAYRAGSLEYGWRVREQCKIGDLLIGTVGTGASRVIVNVNRVEGVGPLGVEWTPETDVPIVPPIGWSEIAARFGRRATWRRLEGAEAMRFISAIAAHLEAAEDIPESEGDIRLGRCRKRSMKNRMRMLDRADGVCEGCHRNFRTGFGARGDRALEVHHLKPLSQTGSKTSTRLRDLAVLCATCHRLVHADPQLRIDSLRLGWLRTLAEA